MSYQTECVGYAVSEVLDLSASIKDDRTISQVFLKLSEEKGELASEIAIEDGYVKNKPKGEDGVTGEAIDVIICALDIIYLHNPDLTKEELLDKIATVMSTKKQKWAEYALSEVVIERAKESLNSGIVEGKKGLSKEEIREYICEEASRSYFIDEGDRNE